LQGYAQNPLQVATYQPQDSRRGNLPQPKTNLFVDNVPQNYPEQELRKLFDQHGNVRSFLVKRVDQQ